MSAFTAKATNSKLADVWADHLQPGGMLAPHEAAFYPAFLSYARQSAKILEIGAGYGRMGRILQKDGVAAQMVFLDINEYVKNCPGIGVVGDARNLPFADDSFDLVYSLGVVEHFKETGLAIEEHIRVARPGGIILVTTPRLSVYTGFRWLSWVVKHRKRGSWMHVVGKNLTICQVRRDLEKGASILAVNASGWVLPSFFKVLAPLASLVPGRLAGAYLYVMARKNHA